MNKTCSAFLVAFWATAAVAVQPTATVTGVANDVQTGFTIIDYALADGPAIVTFEVLKDGLPIDRRHLMSAAGDVNELVSGTTGRIYWQPRGANGIGDATSGSLRFRVKAWRKGAPPDYMVVDLRNRNKRYYYETEAELPYGVDSPRYRVNFVVMRKIPAAGASFSMGSPVYSTTSSELGRGEGETLHRVSLTNDYYMSIFELTHGQFRMYRGYVQKPDGYGAIDRADPVEYVSYEEEIRGWRSNGCKWPQNGHDVSTGWLLSARTITGVFFDLPTEAQWEFAARAGSAAALPNECGQTTAEGVCPMTDRYAWYAGNANGITHNVGQKQPNAWGLYDVVGNVREACLDVWSDDNTTQREVEPVGPTTEERTQYVARGGCYADEPTSTRLAARWKEWYQTSYDTDRGVKLGFRLWCEIPND